MKKDLVEMIFILDRSGSMQGLESDTINGYNAMIEKQKKLPGEAIVSTILFDHEYKVLHHREEIKKIDPMTSNEYFVRGTTALLDAIGTSVNKIIATHKQLKEDYLPEKTLFVITTDGMENASRIYDYQQIKKMIEQQKEMFNWEFIFLGANIDAVLTAKRFGIDEDRAVNYHSDKEGTDLNYRVLGETISELRMNKSIRSSWKKEIEKDYIHRNK